MIICINHRPYVIVQILRSNITRIVFVTRISHPVGSNGQNHILAQTPFKFLPVEEFEKRQKSITSTGSAKDWVPKELMAPPKSSKPAPKPKNGKKKNKKRNK